MRLFKLIIFLLVVGIVALFAYQNIATFTVSHNFVLDLKVRAPIEWSLKVYEILLISMAIGFFIGILLLVKPWLSTRKTLSKVRKEKEALREKLESYQGFPKPGEETQPAPETAKDEKQVRETKEPTTPAASEQPEMSTDKMAEGAQSATGQGEEKTNQPSASEAENAETSNPEKTQE